MEINSGQLIRIQEELASIPEIYLAYLFGSFARGEGTSTSDIDIGIYCNDEIPEDDAGTFKLMVIDKLVQAVHEDDIDVILMDYATISLAFEIIKPNKLIFVRDHDIKVDYEHNVMSRYLDFKYYNQRWDEMMLEKMAKK